MSPPKYFRLGQAFLHGEVIAVQGHAAIAIRGTRKERPRKLLRQPVLTVEAAFGLCQDLDGNGRIKALFEQPLVRCGVIGPDECLVDLFQLSWRRA
jgi:hypothetical protein